MQQVVQVSVEMDVGTDIVVDKGEFGERLKMGNVAHVPCDQIVHADHFIAFADEAITEVGT